MTSSAAPQSCVSTGVPDGVRGGKPEEKDDRGEIVVSYKIPYSDSEQLAPELLAKKLELKQPLYFGHPLSDQLGGQLDAGLLLAGYYEDSWEPGLSAIADRIPCFAATLALKK